MRIQFKAIGFRSAIFAASAAWALLVPWAATEAQIAAGANDSPAPEEKLEEVTVTARRRAENLQTVPIAVTVVSQSKLEENNVGSLLQLQYLVPSMSAYTVSYRDLPTFSIRGLGASIGGGAPAVVTYLNEIPIAAPASLLGAVGSLNGPGLLFDLENVQVLKGPQGTNFGQNAVGGAVLLQTARPKDDLEARLQVGYGNYNNREVDAMFNVPLIQDELLFRIAYNGGWRNGFTHIASTPDHPDGVDADDRNFSSVRGSVTFKPNEAFQNDTIVTYSKYTSNGSPRFVTAINPTGQAAQLFPGITAALAQQEALGTRMHIPIDTVLASSGTTLAVGNVSTVDLTDHLRFRNIFGYNDQKTTASGEGDGTVFPVLDKPSPPQVAIGKQYTEEAQLQGSKTSGGALDWTLGVFYLDQPRQPFSVVTSTTFGKTSDSESSVGATSKAVYGLANYDLSAILPQLTATAGVRYTRDWHIADVRGGPLNNFANPVSAEVTNNAVTWNAGLNYRVAPDTMMYTSVSRGYRSGGNNTAQSNLPGFGPEFVTNYEIGTKSDWRVASIPVRTNAALFYENYTDLQLSDFTLINGVFQGITANAGSARIWGAELEMSAQLTRALQMGVNFDYLNFAFTQFDAGVNVAATELFAKDNRPPYKYGVNARYQLPVPSQIGSMSVQGSWDWQATSGNANLVVSGLIPAYGLLNMTADWSGIGGGPLDAQLYVSNALNKVYFSGGLGGYNLVGVDSYRYGEPRMYGVRLRYQFK
jgi:iron complex outermembrane receptor protein